MFVVYPQKTFLADMQTASFKIKGKNSTLVHHEDVAKRICAIQNVFVLYKAYTFKFKASILMVPRCSTVASIY